MPWIIECENGHATADNGESPEKFPNTTKVDPKKNQERIPNRSRRYKKREKGEEKPVEYIPLSRALKEWDIP
jgi:hypothetical protein